MLNKRKLIPLILTVCLVLGSFGTAYGTDTKVDEQESIPAVTEPSESQELEQPVTEETQKAKPKKLKAQGGGKMVIDDPFIEYNSKKEFTITATVPVEVQDNSEAQAYADGLTWYLDRDANDSPFKKDLTVSQYFKNVYTGDQLKNWSKWSTTAGNPDPLFSDLNVKAKKKNKKVEITFTFKNDLFSGTTWGSPSVQVRNAQGSFVGDYQLSARDGEDIVAAGTMHFVPYESYHTYMDLRDQIKKLQNKAKKKGYELSIDDIGLSEAGFPQYAVIFGKAGKADQWLEMTEQAETDPEGLQKKVGSMDYAIPMFTNNVHSDESPGSDTIFDTLNMMIEEDTINFSQLSGWKQGVDQQNSYITPPLQGIATTLGRDTEAQGVSDVSDRYKIADKSVKVKNLLNNVFFVMVPNENPDGRINNGRRNSKGFDLNRDGTFQTQSETQSLEPYIAKWNPIVMNEYHGYVANFLIEPCTPPHEQNLEYDITAEDFIKMSEVFGNTAVGSLNALYPHGNTEDPHLSKYEIPFRDYYDLEEGWDAWDDLSTNYGPSYAMLNTGAMGYTIEIPYNDQMSTDALTYGTIGMANYMSKNKERLFKNQLEFFKRGVNNIDVTTEEGNELEKWYYDLNDNLLEDDAWRVKFNGEGETGKYFPEYYVIPKDSADQRDVADVTALEEFLARNDVKMKTLNKDTIIDGKTYKEGTLIVDMYQAKRNYANAVLWQGIDAGKDFNGLYSECVVNFPELRGFTSIPIAKKDAIPKANLTDLENPGEGISDINESVKNYTAVIIKNNGNEAVSAVNEMLGEGIEVGFVETGIHKGNFLVEKADWEVIAEKYILSATGVKKAEGVVKKLKTPKVYITGQDAAYTGTGSVITENEYWKDWFADGYGSSLFRSVMNSGTYEGFNFDREAYKEQMSFDIVENPGDATIIVGSMAADRGQRGADSLNQVLAGKPYIATGQATLSVLNSRILPDGFFSFGSSSSSESLHKIKYNADSLITAPQKAAGDDVIYNYGGGRITALNENATILYKAGTIEENFHLAGCYPKENLSQLSGMIEAFTYQGAGRAEANVDVTVFANSTTRKAHQQDDYLFVSNTIFAKHMGDEWTKYSGGTATPENPTDIKTAKIAKITDKVYNGVAKTPALTVKLGGKALKQGTDYKVKYTNNKNIGLATVTITGTGKYKGTASTTFKIVPKAPVVSKITVAKKKMTVKWKGVAKTTKYQVRYKIKGNKKWVTKTVTAKSTNLAIKKLKKGKKYQVQVRAYTTVKAVNYYSAWSKVKTSKKIK